jgi:23S rRNA pseudouridine1911/1915/1917 synthase
MEAAQPRVIIERPDWRVLAKPAGWHTLAHAGGNAERTSGGEAGDAADGPGRDEGADAAPGSLEAWLRAAHPEHASIPEAGIAHRLDQGTSGCVVAGRTAEAHARLRGEVGSSGGARKTYLALARTGLPDDGTFRLYFSSRHKGSRKVTVRREGTGPECGRCRWHVAERAVDGAHDLVEVEVIGRGRRHQVRAGLASLGHPLRGDALYGGDASRDAHPALHAWRVEVDGETVECPPDARFARG